MNPYVNSSYTDRNVNISSFIVPFAVVSECFTIFNIFVTRTSMGYKAVRKLYPIWAAAKDKLIRVQNLPASSELGTCASPSRHGKNKESIP